MTDWIAFSRGPALGHWALAIMVFGLCWRLAAFVFSHPSGEGLYWARNGFLARRGTGKKSRLLMHVWTADRLSLRVRTSCW